MNFFFDIFRSRRVLIMFLLGFASGLPFNLIGSTLSAWLTNCNVDLKLIAGATLVSGFYSVKILWAPLLDRYRVPLLGRRRGWLALFQLLLAGGIAVMGIVGAPRGTHPTSHTLFVMLACAGVVGFLSASQDIVSDAYRTDLMLREERAAGNATATLGYRIAMLTTGGLALIMSDHMSWRRVYFIMAALMLVGVITTVLLAPEPESHAPPRLLTEALFAPLKDYFRRDKAIPILAIILLFGFGDHLARTLSTTFLLRVGFSNSEVGEVTKFFGTLASIAGTFAAAWSIARFGVWRTMFVFASLQPLGAGCYGLLALHGKNHALLLAAVTIDQVTTACAATALDTFLMALVNKRYTATQFALLVGASSILGRFTGATTTGFFAARYGWARFFFGTMFVCVPALFLLWRERRAVEEAEAGKAAETHEDEAAAT